MTGVLAAAIASPSLGEVSLGMPQPSITTTEVSYFQLVIRTAVLLSTVFWSTLAISEDLLKLRLRTEFTAAGQDLEKADKADQRLKLPKFNCMWTAVEILRGLRTKRNLMVGWRLRSVHRLR